MAGVAASAQAEMLVPCCASRPSSGAFLSCGVLHFVVGSGTYVQVYEAKAQALDFPWDGTSPQICIFPSPLAVMNGFRWHGI